MDEERLSIRIYLSLDNQNKDDQPVHFEQIDIVFQYKALWQKVRAVLGK